MPNIERIIKEIPKFPKNFNHTIYVVDLSELWWYKNTTSYLKGYDRKCPCNLKRGRYLPYVIKAVIRVEYDNLITFIKNCFSIKDFNKLWHNAIIGYGHGLTCIYVKTRKIKPETFGNIYQIDGNDKPSIRDDIFYILQHILGHSEKYIENMYTLLEKNNILDDDNEESGEGDDDNGESDEVDDDNGESDEEDDD